ncbi:MAG: Ada metal-binding domain-containing protein [Bacteroidota bacterium]
MMYLHSDLGSSNFERLRSIVMLRNGGRIVFAGNRRGKIYGSLHCKAGKRLKREHRVFFDSEAAAIEQGYRPCGHCLRSRYREWRLRQ